MLPDTPLLADEAITARDPLLPDTAEPLLRESDPLPPCEATFDFTVNVPDEDPLLKPDEIDIEPPNAFVAPPE
jgi:hypothetical protein